jgi:type I restriction enzyme M protein
VLFIDARHIYRQVDRAHRDWTPAQIGFMANLVRLWRGEALDYTLGGDEAREKIEEVFAAKSSDPAGLNGQDMHSAHSLAAESPTPYGSSDEIEKLPSTFGRRAGDEGAVKHEGAGNVAYSDIPGLCKAATLKEIEAQGWSLNPGRYVGVAPGEAISDEDFKVQLETLNEELELLNAQARELEATIAGNVAQILET